MEACGDAARRTCVRAAALWQAGGPELAGDSAQGLLGSRVTHSLRQELKALITFLGASGTTRDAAGDQTGPVFLDLWHSLVIAAPLRAVVATTYRTEAE
jgi:hypothetical protein